MAERVWAAPIRYFPPPAGLDRWPPVKEWDDAWWLAWCRAGGMTEQQAIATVASQHYWGVKRHEVIDGKLTPRIKEWVYRPTPRQCDAHACEAPNMFFGGARGGAKSKWVRQEAYRRCALSPDYQILILRRTFPELERTHIRWAARELPQYGAKVVGEHGIWPNGANIEFGHCQDDRAVARYLSAEYHAVFVDEAPTFPKDMVLEIAGSIRSPNTNRLAILRLTGNPGGAHTLWLVDRFIDKVVEHSEDEYYRPEDWVFIQSRLYDNPYLMDADGTFTRYEARLGALSPERRRQWMDGDWSAIGGQFFSEFSRTTHVAELPIPDGTVFERWIDWGYNAPGVCLWVACLPDRRLYVCQEYMFRQTIAANVAANIATYTKQLESSLGFPVRIRKTVADESMFNKTGATAESIAETFSRNGVVCNESDRQRELGWQRLRHWLQLSPDGRPWMVFDPSCRYTLRTLPSLTSDPHNPEDVDTDGDDHAADALRYGVMARPAPSRVEVSREMPVGSLGWWKQREAGTGSGFVLGQESVRRH